MAKIKLTKGELKKQRDALKQYERYLPTLQLKKQQLQMEILHQLMLIEEKEHREKVKINSAISWAGLLVDPALSNFISIFRKGGVKPKRIIIGSKNIAGVDVPIFERAEFDLAEYDLFIMPLWVDHALEILRDIVSLRQEIEVIKKGIEILRQELRVTTQRVNLFEKVKIPETKEAIRLIKIYIGDQMANAVGRSKIAKSKIERAELVEVSLA